MKTVKLETIPDCQICEMNGVKKPATHDDKTINGPWGYLCADHQRSMGAGVGFKLVKA